jgi:hypothetical protein
MVKPDCPSSTVLDPPSGVTTGGPGICAAVAAENNVKEDAAKA